MRTNNQALIALALLAAAPVAAQQAGSNYPNRAIRFILPFPPGGGTDIVGRVLAQRLAEETGQPVIPDNRAGAGGNLGAEIVAKAAPDGYTIVMATVSLAVSPTLYKKLNYDPVKDLAPIGLVAASPNTLAVHPSTPARSVKDLVTLARAQQGRVSFGTGGPGSLNDLISQVFRSISNGKALVVPYKGINPATIAMLSGEVDAAVISVASAAQYVNSGKLRALATLAPERSALLPKVPTSKEAGYPELEAVLWYGMLAPAGTPQAIITRLNQSFTRISNAADTRERLAGVGTLPMTSTPEQFAEFLKKEIVRWGKVVRDSGASAE
ncbi:MAG: tripartite tricarboxylate transporter substrate binding protein [Betaproteobacteria bacterium]|nr:tripartite tricarboxylate transporter substrate binding protein [Betaproteobacteria bacterium]